MQLIRRVVLQRWSPKLNDMGTNPLGEISFRAVPRCGGEHRGDNIRLFGSEVETVQAKEHDHREERHTLVAVTIRMILNDAVAICCSQTRKVWTALVRPFVLRSSTSRLQEPFVTKTWQAPVFSNLIKVNRVYNDSLHPSRFDCFHLLFGQLAERVSVPFRGASSNCERFLRLGIVGCEEYPVFGFDGQKSVTRCNSKAIGHVFGKSGGHRAANSTHGNFFNHVTYFAELT